MTGLIFWFTAHANLICNSQTCRSWADEYWGWQKEITARINYLENLLADPKQQLETGKRETAELTEKYGDDRRTSVEADAVEHLSDSDLVDDQSVFITLTERGYIKRVNANVYRTYNRGAVGVSVMD